MQRVYQESEALKTAESCRAVPVSEVPRLPSEYPQFTVGVHDISISKVWANAWMEYLFYDTELFLENILTRNFNIPTPPMHYDFTINIGDQVIKLNNELRHIIYRIYKSNYLGQSVLEPKDEQVLAWGQSSKLNDKLLVKVEKIRDSLLKKKVKQTKVEGCRDEWLEFQDEDNVYEHTLQDNHQEDMMEMSPELNSKREGMDDIGSHRRFHDDIHDNDSQFVKATMDNNIFHEDHEPDANIELGSNRSQSESAEDGEDGEKEDTALEAQLSNRYHSKINSTVPNKDTQVHTLKSPSLSKGVCVRGTGDAIASLKTKIHLNKLYLPK